MLKSEKWSEAEMNEYICKPILREKSTRPIYFFEENPNKLIKNKQLKIENSYKHTVLIKK